MVSQLQRLPTLETLGTLEPVAHFEGAMPTGVTVSHQGRIFVNFPKWGDEVAFTVAEIREGRPVAYPVAIDALVDRSIDDSAVAATVIDEGDKGGGAEGLKSKAVHAMRAFVLTKSQFCCGEARKRSIEQQVQEAMGMNQTLKVEKTVTMNQPLEID